MHKASNIALWQQATLEVTRRDDSIMACSRHIHMVLFFAHNPLVVERAFSATPAKWLQRYILLLVKCSLPYFVLPSLQVMQKHLEVNILMQGLEERFLNQLTLTMNFWNGKKNHLTFSISLFGNNYKQTSNHATKNKPHKNSVILFPGNLK